jgi:hypothetical protein
MDLGLLALNLCCYRIKRKRTGAPLGGAAAGTLPHQPAGTPALRQASSSFAARNPLLVASAFGSAAVLGG